MGREGLEFGWRKGRKGRRYRGTERGGEGVKFEKRKGRGKRRVYG